MSDSVDISAIPLVLQVPTFRCQHCERIASGHPFKRTMQTGSISGVMMLGDTLGATSSAVEGFVDLCSQCAGAYDEAAAAQARNIRQRNRIAAVALIFVLGLAALAAVIALASGPHYN